MKTITFTDTQVQDVVFLGDRLGNVLGLLRGRPVSCQFTVKSTGQQLTGAAQITPDGAWIFRAVVK